MSIVVARIAGVSIPLKKRLVIALTRIYGIGLTSAKKICEVANISENILTQDLTDEQLVLLRNIVSEQYYVEGDLRREVEGRVKRKKDIKCYQGLRHIKRLPVRGQRTHSNARTRKGKAVAIAGKKKVTK